MEKKISVIRMLNVSVGAVYDRAFPGIVERRAVIDRAYNLLVYPLYHTEAVSAMRAMASIDPARADGNGCCIPSRSVESMVIVATDTISSAG